MISIISTVYNGEKYFDRAIPSILAQDYKDFEYIIVDDGSKDNTLSMLREIEKEDNRIKVFSSGKLGRPEALNYAVKHCSYDYIAQQDFDDISYPNRLRTQLEYLQNHNDIGWVGSWYNVKNSISNQSFTRKVPENHNEIIKYCARAIPFAHTLVMFKKQAWQEAGYYPLYDDIEDFRLCINIAKQGYIIANIPVSLGIHFIHQNSFWHTNFKYIKRQKTLAQVQRKAINDLNLPFWMHIYPAGRLLYARLNPSFRKSIRRLLGGSKEADE